MAVMNQRTTRRIKAATSVIVGLDDQEARNLKQWSVHPFKRVPEGEESLWLARAVMNAVLFRLLEAAPQEVVERIEADLDQQVMGFCLGTSGVDVEKQRELAALIFGRQEIE